MISFSPSKDFGQLLDEGRRDLEAWRVARGDHKEAKWAEWAGGKLGVMLRERKVTIRFLKSPNRYLRLAAISLVAEYWFPNERFAADALRLAFEDSEPAIRGAALAALYWLKRYVSDPTGILTRLVKELFPGEPEAVVAARKQKFREKMAHGRELWKKMWEEDAGPHAIRMVQSRDLAESYLSHPDPKVRRAAILVLDHHWKPDAKFPRLCERMVFEDPDLKVRCLALSCLAGCYSHTDDLRVGALVARLVRDNSKPRHLRTTAYRTLFLIRGMPVEASMEAESANFRFPEDVDWLFVDSFLKEDESG